MTAATWHIITSEYPPQLGGVSDYTFMVANGLAAAGDGVHVWCRGNTNDSPAENSAGVLVHRELGHLSPTDLSRAGKLLDKYPAPRRLLVQWVPHGYGYRSMNLPFCFWLWRRASRPGDEVELMVHEPFLAFGEGSIKQDIAAAVHRVMIVMLLKAASRVWVSIPEWETRLHPFLLGARKSFGWLPVPSNIPFVDDPAGVAATRARYASSGRSLVGHFGAYDKYLNELMLKVLPSLQSGLHGPSVLLVGRGSLELREQLLASHPNLSQVVHATGPLSVEEVSRHISACDVMLQPYQDGVSGRRTSVMTALSHGVPVVTTRGKATEPTWFENNAVVLTEAGDINALVAATRNVVGDDAERRRLSASGRELYQCSFDLERTICRLRPTAYAPLFAFMSAGCA